MYISPKFITDEIYEYSIAALKNSDIKKTQTKGFTPKSVNLDSSNVYIILKYINQVGDIGVRAECLQRSPFFFDHDPLYFWYIYDPS